MDYQDEATSCDNKQNYASNLVILVFIFAFKYNNQSLFLQVVMMVYPK